jgi:peptide chain release factor 1
MMKDSIRQKLEKAEERFEEVGRMLADPAIAGSSDQFRELSMEYARLQPTAEAFRGYRALTADLAAAANPARPRCGNARPAEEVTRLNMALEAREQDLARLLLPHDPRDEGNIIWKSAPAAMKLRSSLAICCVCTRAMPSVAVGRSKR